MTDGKDAKGRLAPGSFLIISAGAPFDPRLGNAAVRVLAALSSFRRTEDNVAFPGTDLLASGLGLSVRAVQKQLRKLEQLGYIKEVVDPKARFRGSRTWWFAMIPRPSIESMRSGTRRSLTANSRFAS